MKARRGLAALLLCAAFFARPVSAAASSSPDAALVSMQAEIVQKKAEISRLFDRLHAVGGSCAEGRDLGALKKEHSDLQALIERKLTEFGNLCKDYNSGSDALMESRLLVLAAGKDSSGVAKELAEHSSRDAFAEEVKNVKRAYRTRFDVEVFEFETCARDFAKRHRRTFALEALSVCAALAILAALYFGVRRRKLGPAPAAGSIVGGNYRILREAARRDWGVVFEAEDVALRRGTMVEMVSEKLTGERRALARFLGAARRASALKHGNLLETYAMFEEGGRLYLVCESCAGRPLEELLADGSTLSLAPAKLLLKQAAGALDYVHSRGLLYGVLSPAMILVTPEGSVKLMDIAVAHGMRLAGKRASGAESGSASAYWAPELARGEARVESDLFSLGAVARRLLGAPLALEGVFRRALHEDPRRRYHSGAEFMAALEAIRP